MTVLEIKALVRFRDGNRCTECGLTNEEHLERYGRSLEVHRKTPGSKYAVADCQTLCRSCHGPKPKRPRGTYDSPYRIVTLPAVLATPLQEVADDNVTDLTTEVKQAVREYLERLGRWHSKHRRKPD